jgi:GT2 family glycosyltransferase
MSIGCIIIAYKKNIKFIQNRIDNIYSDVDNFYIINNSESNFLKIKSRKINVINLDVNLGIAAAQNLALSLAYKNKNKFVLFKSLLSAKQFEMKFHIVLVPLGTILY